MDGSFDKIDGIVNLSKHHRIVVDVDKGPHHYYNPVFLYMLLITICRIFVYIFSIGNDAHKAFPTIGVGCTVKWDSNRFIHRLFSIQRIEVH